MEGLVGRRGLQVGGLENGCFGRMSHELYRISEPQSKAALDFNALQTFASRACPFGYITYPGTLIGRADLVNVIWIVYTDPIDICCQNVSRRHVVETIEIVTTTVLGLPNLCYQPVS